MIDYDQFLALSQSHNSEERAQAAFLVASALVAHEGASDEHAALFASVISFLDDSSLKVRAALAYGLLRSTASPRVAILALAKDAPIVSRAVLQHSPILIDADLIGFAKTLPVTCLLAICARPHLSAKLINALMAREELDVDAALLKRQDLALDCEQLDELAERHLGRAKMRGLLLARPTLSSMCRHKIMMAITLDLRHGRLVSGALTQNRADKLFRDAIDDATCVIGESATNGERRSFVPELRQNDQINTRLLLHALLHGHALFFSQCVAELCEVPESKAMSILADGARATLNGLLTRSGMSAGLRNLMTRLIMLARDVDLSDDVSSRFLVVTELVQALIEEHDGEIPDELADGFAYLNEQNLTLARAAAKGILSDFVDADKEQKRFPHSQSHIDELLGVDRIALPAA